MRVLCGQCGHLNRLDDDYAEPTVTCAKCGRVVRVAAPAEDAAAGSPALVAETVAVEVEELGFAEQARQAEGRKITVTCAHCGRVATVSARVAGMKARCKGCNEPLEIPYPDDLVDFELPRLYRGADEAETGLELAPPPGRESEPLAPLDSIQETEVELEIAPQPVSAPGATEGGQDAAESARRQVASYDPAEHLAALDKEYTPTPPAPQAPEPPQEAGELASAVQDFHGSRPEAARARRRQAGGSRTVQWVLLLGIAAAVIALPLAVVLPMLLSDGDANGLEEIIRHDRPSPGPEGPGGSTQAGTTTRRTGTQPFRAPGPAPTPRPRTPSCTVLAAVPGALAAGALPAPPRSVYWRLTVRVSAGADPVSFKAQGRDVRLVFGAERFESLGIPADGGGLFPAPGKQAAVSLQPGEQRVLTFLFEVPADRTAGGLFIRRVAYEDITLPAVDAPAGEALRGTWREAPPRHLKPMLRDPVMAAIQAAPDQRLMISPAPDGLHLAIPDARVAGVGRPAGPGLFQTSLTCDGHVLNGAMLRFADGGRRAILYLAEGPYHQLTYVNPQMTPPAAKPMAAKAPPKPDAPLPPVGPEGPGIRRSGDWEDPPVFDPNEKPPKPKPAKLRPGELPTGPSIFD